MYKVKGDGPGRTPIKFKQSALFQSGSVPITCDYQVIFELSIAKALKATHLFLYILIYQIP